MKRNANFFCCLGKFFLFLSFCVPADASDTVAEIINLNPTLQAVFIDLGKGSVQKGDVFVAEDPSGNIFLQVQDVSPAVSKLGLSQDEQFKNEQANFQLLTIGTMVKRVKQEQPQRNLAGVSDGKMQLPIGQVQGFPNIDPQVLVKPNIANETIQSLDIRLDKMVESNVKLFNSLTELLNEKKQWQSEMDTLRNQLQEVRLELQQVNLSKTELNKQLADANYQIASSKAEFEKVKKALEESNSKVQALKDKLEAMSKMIQQRLK